MRVHLRAQPLRHGGHGARVLHAAVVGVQRGDELFVGVHGVVVVQVVAELLVELRQEPVLDQGRGRCVDSWFALWGVRWGELGGDGEGVEEMKEMKERESVPGRLRSRRRRRRARWDG